MKQKNYLFFMQISWLLALIPQFSVAQLLVKSTFMETTDVSNAGMVAGYENQAGPYFLWTPESDESTNIGGAAPGNGIGGQATFSADGTKLSGTSFTDVPNSTAWQRNVLTNYNYIFKAIQFPGNQNFVGYAAGQSLTNNGNGIVLRTTNGGATWNELLVDTEQNALETMSFPSEYTGYVCGWNNYFAKTTDGGWSWTPLDPAGDTNVYIYNAVCFKDDDHGIVAAQLDENVAVYYTNDGGTTWQVGTGLVGVASKIKFVEATTYFLVTTDGKIQKSVDEGATWSTVYSQPFTVLTEINFIDAQHGFAVGDNTVLRTDDGGVTWTTVSSPAEAIWRAIEWVSETQLFLAGTPDLIYESNDGGMTWSWSNQTLFNGDPALYDIAITGNAVHVCGSQGNFYYKSLLSTLNVAQLSLYDVNTNEWTPKGGLGQIVDNNSSAGWAMSGDGNTIVGNAWADPNNGDGLSPYAHAFAWNATDGLTDMGSLFATTNRSSRADAVSQDGSVAVGYQDFNGPWKSAVWRKNPAGGYFPNQYLLVDPAGSVSDEFNQLGQCNAVSANGIWIGGDGDYAFPNAWIWSEATGLIDLGNMGLTDVTGHVTSMNSDGSRVVGYYLSNDFWSATYTPFLWTPTLGMVNLNTWMTDTLQIEVDPGTNIYMPSAISPNGKYIAGFGIIEDDLFGTLFNYRLEIPDNLGVKSNSLQATTLFPNPTKDFLMVSTINAIDKYEIWNINGQLLKSGSQLGHLSKIDLAAFDTGIYFVKLYSNTDTKSIKVVKN